MFYSLAQQRNIKKIITSRSQLELVLSQELEKLVLNLVNECTDFLIPQMEIAFLGTRICVDTSMLLPILPNILLIITIIYFDT